MDTITLDNPPAVAGPGRSWATILGLAALGTFTILITARARVLEVTLERQSEEPALVRKAAPDFSAPTLDGRTVSLSEFRGQKKVVVSFWASWCGPCRAEMPALARFYQRNHTPSSDFEILAVSIDEDPKDAMAFASTQKLNFPVLLDPQQKMATTYAVEGIPVMFVIDKDGKVTYGHEGYDMAMEYRLTSELGIKPKKPSGEETDDSAGH